MNNVSALVNEMGIKERSDGRYEGRITVNGVRKSFYGSTKTEIKQKAKTYLMKVENGFKEPLKIRLNEYIEYWLMTYKLNKIEPSSYERLYRVYVCQIRDTIGNKMIGSLTTADIQKLIDSHAYPKTDGIKPLAVSGLKRIVHLLRPCLNMAVKEGVISSNPCLDVLIPVESCVLKETRTQDTLDDSEIEEFRTAALEKYKTTNDYCSRDRLVLLLIMNLGLRVGEMLALEWTDINFGEKIIHINKTVQSNIRDDGRGEKYRIKKCAKTKSGIRVLPVNETVEQYFRELQEYDRRHNIVCNYVCCTSSNTRQTARNLQRSLDRMLKSTGIKKNVTLHTLRHTFGSTLVRKGIGIEVVSSLMGHANITITYLKYIHVIQEQKAKAMTAIKIC